MHTKEKVAVLFATLTLFLPIAAVATTSNLVPDSNWTIYNRIWTNGSVNTKTSSPISLSPNVVFSFPNSGTQLSCGGCSGTSSTSFTGFLLDKVSLSLTTSNTITATFSVPATSGTPAFVGNPDGYACGTATTVRLFFQSTGTGNPGALTSKTFETKYWWANPTDTSVGSYSFVTGGTATAITLSVPLNGADWSDFYGHHGTGSFGTNFNSALGAVKYIGLSFGSGCFFANGVGVDGTTGSANLQLTSFSVS